MRELVLILGIIQLQNTAPEDFSVEELEWTLFIAQIGQIGLYLVWKDLFGKGNCDFRGTVWKAQNGTERHRKVQND